MMQTAQYPARATDLRGLRASSPYNGADSTPMNEVNAKVSAAASPVPRATEGENDTAGSASAPLSAKIPKSMMTRMRISADMSSPSIQTDRSSCRRPSTAISASSAAEYHGQDTPGMARIRSAKYPKAP